jgi:hypothetical protein
VVEEVNRQVRRRVPHARRNLVSIVLSSKAVGVPPWRRRPRNPGSTIGPAAKPPSRYEYYALQRRHDDPAFEHLICCYEHLRERLSRLKGSTRPTWICFAARHLSLASQCVDDGSFAEPPILCLLDLPTVVYHRKSNFDQDRRNSDPRRFPRGSVTLYGHQPERSRNKPRQ